MWGTCAILFIGIIYTQNRIESLNSEYGKLVSSAEYRHAMMPKYIHDLPPEINNGPTPINIQELPRPVSDNSAPPIEVKHKITPAKMEETISIEPVEVLDTHDVFDMVRKHRSVIKATRIKDTTDENH